MIKRFYFYICVILSLVYVLLYISLESRLARVDRHEISSTPIGLMLENDQIGNEQNVDEILLHTKAEYEIVGQEQKDYENITAGVEENQKEVENVLESKFEDRTVVRMQKVNEHELKAGFEQEHNISAVFNNTLIEFAERNFQNDNQKDKDDLFRRDKTLYKGEKNITMAKKGVHGSSSGKDIRVNPSEQHKCNDHLVKLPQRHMPQSEGKKLIVWFDMRHNNHGLRNSAANARFKHCKGIAKNCKIMTHHIVNELDKPNESNANVWYKEVGPIKADAVIFQGCHLPSLPALKRMDENQVFILAERENWWANNMVEKFNAPQNMHALYYVNKFNWTMTYRYDSDIPFPYGKIIPPHRYFRDMNNYDSIYKDKRFEVVWLVSHCNTPSQREHFVNGLKKFISVHIYGKCGWLQCAKGNNHCFNKIIKSYKFVLSFENTYQTNYVTEKLFKWFPHNIVPVVRGGETDYTRHGVPEGTIVNADAFKSPESLAKHLLKIGDKQTYIGMLKKKAGYRVISMDRIQKKSYCQLCQMLNTLDEHRQYYNHIGSWFSSKLNSKSYCIKEQ